MAIVTTNLEAWYDSTNPASNTGSGTTLYDLSGNGLNATINNPTRVSNYFEMSKSTTNKSIDLGSNLSSYMSGASCQFTIEMWMWVDSAAGPNPDRYSSYAGNYLATGGFTIAGERPNAGGGTQTNIGMYFISPYYQWNPGTLSNGSWIQYTFVNDGATRRIYENGTQIFSATLGSSSIAAGDVNFQLGGPNEGYYGWNGKFSIGRVYSKALTVGEIQQNYYTDLFNINPPAFKIVSTDPASYPGTGNTWFDLTPNNRDWTFNTVPTYSAGYFNYDSSIVTNYGLTTPYTFPSLTGNNVQSSMEYWIYCDSSINNPNKYRLPFTNDLTNSSSSGFAVVWERPGASGGVQGANIYFSYDNGGTVYISPTYFNALDQWIHIVYVRSGTNLKIYQNGIEVQNVTLANANVRASLGSTSGIFTPVENESGFDGKLAQVAGYPYALTAGEVLGLYNLGLPVPPSPIPSKVASYDFGDPASYSGSGLTVNDLTGNGNNLTFTAAPTYNSALGGYVELDNTMSANLAGTFPNNLPFGQSDFSMILWGKVPSTYNVAMFALGGGSPAGARVDLGYGFSPSVLGTEFYNSGIRQDTSPSPGTWFQYVITGVAGNATTQLLTYVNGSLDTITSVTAAPVIDFNNASTFPGSNPRLSINWQGAPGDMSIIKAEVYDYAISAGDVTTDYAALQARITPPVPSKFIDYDITDPLCYPGTGSTIFDLTANNNDLTIVGSPTFSNPAGQFNLEFNGPSGSGEGAYGFGFTGLTAGNIFTRNYWFQTSSTSADQWSSSLGYYYPPSFAVSEDLIFNGGNYAPNWGANVNALAGGTLSIDTWYNVIFVADGTDQYLYINGTLVDSDIGTQNKSLTPADFGFCIGGYIDKYTPTPNWNAVSLFNGKFAIYQVFDGALDGTQVLDLYNTYASRFAAPYQGNVGGRQFGGRFAG